MIYREVERINLKLSVIGLGAGGLNKSKDPSITLSQAKKVIKLAVNKGINFIDMGKEYDERFIGRCIGKLRKKIYVITRSESRDEEEVEKDIEDSIKKLEVNPAVYEIMVNSVEDFKKSIKNNVLRVLEKAKLSGKIKSIGIFSHKTEVLREAIKTNKFDVISTLYNAVHRKAEEIFPFKKKYNFIFIAAAPFATGILVDPKYEENVHRNGCEFMNAENALKFVLSSPYVDAVVVGMKNSIHVGENVKIVSKEWKLTEREREEISKKMERFLGENFCRMCRYCEGCQEVSVADILKLLILAKSYGYLNFAKWQYQFFKNKIEGKNFDKCEKLCPYKLPINNLIKKVENILGR